MEDKEDKEVCGMAVLLKAGLDFKIIEIKNYCM